MRRARVCSLFSISPLRKQVLSVRGASTSTAAMMNIVTVSLMASLLGLASASSTHQPIRLNLTGHIDPSQVMSFVYAPFQVPAGVTSLYVLQSYSKKGAGNALDLGCFDQRGVQLADAMNGTTGWRGWSGGFR